MTLESFLLSIYYQIEWFAKSDLMIFVWGGLSCIGVMSVPYIIRWIVSLRR